MTRRIRDPQPWDDLPEWRDALRVASIPERYWTATPDAIRDPKLRDGVCELVRTAPVWLAEARGFYCHGPLGTGKSSIAGILAMEAVRRCERVSWLPVRDVPTVRFRENDEARRRDDRLRTTDLLVLDDLGAERFRLSSAAGTALEEVVRTIYDRKRSIVITSNISWNAFLRDYGREAEPLMSVVSRIVVPFEVVNSQWVNPAGGASPPTP
jgi:DNA replication protein DnaC